MTPLLTLRNVTWGPRRGARSAGGVSFEVAPGQLVALSGPAGAGKSTLLRLISRAEPPRGGAVLLAGRDIWLTSAPEAARLVCPVLSGGAQDDAMPLRALLVRSRLQLRRNLRAALLEDHDEAVLAGVMTRLQLQPLAEQPYARLSARDRLRADIALALVRRPQLVVADERPDPGETAELLRLLAGLRASGLSAVVAVPDPALAGRYADRVVTLPQGSLAASCA
jgi:iron complex transport system ATP-binding protein